MSKQTILLAPYFAAKAAMDAYRQTIGREARGGIAPNSH